jgi:hypothetical protein
MHGAHAHDCAAGDDAGLEQPAQQPPGLPLEMRAALEA